MSHSPPQPLGLHKRKPFLNDTQAETHEDHALLTPPPTPPAPSSATFPPGSGQVDDSLRSPTLPDDAHDTLMITTPMPRTEIAQLWLRSKCRCCPNPTHHVSAICPKLNQDPEKDNEHYNRKATMTNLGLAFRMWIILLPRLCKFLWTRHPYLTMVWLLRHFMSGVLPACRLWASSQMLDMVQEAMTHGPLDVNRVLRAAAIAWIFESVNDIYQTLSLRNVQRLRKLHYRSGSLFKSSDISTNSPAQESVNDVFETEYLKAGLDLSIPSQYDPYIRPLMYEAGIFATAHHRPNLRYPLSKTSYLPFTTFASIVEILSEVVSMVMQFFLIVRTTRSSGNDFFSYQSLIPILLAIAPLVCSWIRKWVRAPHALARSKALFESEFLDNFKIRRLARSDEAKQDIAIYGLRGWLLEQYAKTKEGYRLAREKERTTGKVLIRLTLFLTETGLEDLWNILLATGIMSTQLSLGSIRLYQSATRSLSRSLDPLLEELTVVFQMVFHLPAFVEVTTFLRNQKLEWRDEKEVHHIDYEDTRADSGMRIEARGLGFAYQGKDPVLRDINLTIEPGQTIAILGLNGAGKTTLTKVLMGLYSHTGSLTINGHPIEQYDLASVHKRTSCIFQDFHMFPISVSDNVGIGQIEYVRDEERVTEARVRGGVKEDEKGVDVALEADQAESDEKTKNLDSASSSSIMSLRRLLMTIWSLFLQIKIFVLGSEDEDKAEKKKKDTDVPKMSGGEKQRVAIARAFMRVDKADLLVFDEPSANLDPEAEEALFDQIHSLPATQNRKITTIFISHRVRTVHKADKIVVLNDKTIKEIGTHEELMQLEGTYHGLYTRSRERFDQSPASPLSPVSDNEGAQGAQGPGSS